MDKPSSTTTTIQLVLKVPMVFQVTLNLVNRSGLLLIRLQPSMVFWLLLMKRQMGKTKMNGTPCTKMRYKKQNKRKKKLLKHHKLNSLHLIKSRLLINAMLIANKPFQNTLSKQLMAKSNSNSDHNQQVARCLTAQTLTSRISIARMAAKTRRHQKPGQQVKAFQLDSTRRVFHGLTMEKPMSQNRLALLSP